MRLLAFAVIALLLGPVAATAKDRDAQTRVVWNSTPDGVRAGGTWDARVSVVQGPGGYAGGKLRPEIVVTPLLGGPERSVPMVVDVPPNTFRAAIPFPRADVYEVAVKGIDPRDPERFIDIGQGVRIAPARAPAAAAAGSGGTAWPRGMMAAAALAALLAAWSVQRVRARDCVS